MLLVSVAVPPVGCRRRCSAELPLTVLLVSVAVPPVEDAAAAAAAAVLPLTVLLVSVAVPVPMMPPPLSPAVLPLTVLLVSVAVPALRCRRRRSRRCCR